MRCTFIVSSTLGVWLMSIGTIFCTGLLAENVPLTDDSPSRYGVDESFPMHYRVKKNKLYNTFISGCREKYAPNGHICDITENERLEMNLHQPAGLVNYTEQGFAKVHAPDHLVEILNRFWKANYKSPQNIPNETWSPGNTYTNHWVAPTKMLQVEVLRGGGETLRSKVWDISKEVLERWTGVELSPSSLYGVRVYTEGAILAPHVDRMPLVISAIVNVAQDVDEPWPLEVIGHDGMAFNITLEPGEMILYESASVIHGRPFPLRGRYYANIFIHFEPLGHGLRHDQATSKGDLAMLYEQAWRKQQTECSKDGNDNDCKLQIDFNMEESMIPPYILPESEEAKRWLQEHSYTTTSLSNSEERAKKVNDKLDANFAAAAGNLKLLKHIVQEDPRSLHRVDRNGWSPLTEAARGGHQEVLEWLLQEGANINQRTHRGNGIIIEPFSFSQSALGC